jgi:DNA-directed RNA polymerase specialized sigma subunit
MRQASKSMQEIGDVLGVSHIAVSRLTDCGGPAGVSQ